METMIKIENTEVVGWEHAVRGMRSPFNSWKKSDSFKADGFECMSCTKNRDCQKPVAYCVGDNDLSLMQKLVKAGTDHRKFMRMIVVYADIVAPMYWWKEFDTYKVGTVRNSCSTMHKITAKEFEIDDFSHEHFVDELNDFLKDDIIDFLNGLREAYVKYDEASEEIKDTLRERDGLADKKHIWNCIIQLLPSSYNQRSTVMLNYEILANMYHSRKNHKLDEWREFCKWIETLPYAELITGEENCNADK